MKSFIAGIVFLLIRSIEGFAQPADSLTQPHRYNFEHMKDAFIAKHKTFDEKKLEDLKESLFRFKIDMGALDTLIQNLPIPHDIEISDKAIRIDIDTNGDKWDAFTASSKKKEREDIVKFGGDVIVNSNEQVNGDVVVIFGNAKIMGEVNGGVVVIFGNAQLTATSIVKNDVVCVWGDTQIEDGAQIKGVTTVFQLGKSLNKNLNTHIFSSIFTVFRFLRFILLFAFLLLIYLAFPKSVEIIQDRISTEYAKSLIVGIIGLILLPVVFVILLITILGIPIAILILPLAVVVGFLLGGAGFCLFLGRSVQNYLGLKITSSFLHLVIGMLLLELLPFLKKVLESVDPTLSTILLIVTFSIFFLAWIPGFGAVLLTRFGTVRLRRTKKSV